MEYVQNRMVVSFKWYDLPTAHIIDAVANYFVWHCVSMVATNTIHATVYVSKRFIYKLRYTKATART